MNIRSLRWPMLAMAVVLLSGCKGKEPINESAAAPPKTEVVNEADPDQVHVSDPQRFTLVTAAAHRMSPEIHATGVVSPDVDRSIPVVSLATGRVAALNAKLGDDVKKGQVLLRVLSNDIANAFQAYGQAKADEVLSARQLERAKLLYDRGAISLNDLQVAEDTEQKAVIARDTAAQSLRTLGADPDRPSSIVDVVAPVSGTIVEQNIAPAGSVRAPDSQQSLFTIADLSRVWVLCDVFENDLPSVRIGDTADVRLNAYPDRVFHGRIGNVGKVLDPTIRTAKVRIELSNPGIMRAGMFVNATFFGVNTVQSTAVPASAVLHLHDRDWVFTPASNGDFRRHPVQAGRVESGMQLVESGLAPGQQVVKDALALSAESEQ